MAENVYITLPEARFCIICAEEGNNKIVKDGNFVAMLDTYWNGIGADVKPDLTKECSLCLPCYDAVLQFYQINDALVCFERKLREAQMNILRKNIKGIVSWQEKGLQPMTFMHDIISKWGTKLEPGENEGYEQKYGVAVTLTKKDFDHTEQGGNQFK